MTRGTVSKKLGDSMDGSSIAIAEMLRTGPGD
jgi:hypothetical protein